MASPSRFRRLLAQPLVRDYGMFAVLLLLVVLFSVLTFSNQIPTGAEAGRRVADDAAALVQDGGVLVVGGSSAADDVFTRSAAEALESRGVPVVAVVNGSARDARKAMETAAETNRLIDAVAATGAAAKWTVYERFDLRPEVIVTPRAVRWPVFLKRSNLLSVANQTAIYAIIAIGMTMVIITAGIDLSVGSLVALAAVAAALFLRDVGGGTGGGVGAVVAGTLIGVAVCGLAGAFNGLLVTWFGVPSFIATLGMMMMASGLAFRLSDGRSIDALPPAFFWLGRGQTLGIPNPVVVMVVLYLLAHFVMSRTVFGRYIYALGGNPEAARLSGVRTSRVLVAVYVISGALAGLGGVMLASQLGAGDPKFGQMYELDVIAAVVVGGTSLLGGQGKIFGTLIGAFIIAVIKNGMNLTNVDPFNQRIALGAVLTAAVLLDTLKRRTTG